MNQLTKHLIVISFDCLSALDFPLLEKLPNFKQLLNNGAYCRNVETIYPSVTYPCHATIVTGNFPNRHGIISNTLLQPGNPSPDWFWHRKHIKGTTLYDEAKNSGMTTAALLWPVTAGAKIDYNMPEIFANRRWDHQIAVSLRNGSPLYQLEMNRRFGSLRNGLSQPELDNFVLESSIATIKTRKPNLMLIHFTDLDTQRHYHGFSSKEAMDAINRHDARLGKIMLALREAQLFDQSTIIALGDHSALDESKAIKPNVLLKEHGLISMNKSGKITEWKAYCKSCDGSAYLYVKEDAKETVNNLLETLMTKKENGIEKIITGAVAAAKGADGSATYMLEAELGYYFTEGHEGDYIETISAKDVATKKYTFATHGYSPEKEQYETLFIASGQGIQENAILPYMHLVDEGPTFARLLGLSLGTTDGRVRKELLRM
jgi:predicted AlkP superfamily pyrophosphatase or phosphodiesterase